jgi:hypothetical protein
MSRYRVANTRAYSSWVFKEIPNSKHMDSHIDTNISQRNPIAIQVKKPGKKADKFNL